jgi:hypothetical protein
MLSSVLKNHYLSILAMEFVQNFCGLSYQPIAQLHGGVSFLYGHEQLIGVEHKKFNFHLLGQKEKAIFCAEMYVYIYNTIIVGNVEQMYSEEYITN